MHTYRRCFYFWYFFFAVSFDILWYGYICWNHSIAVNALNTYIHSMNMNPYRRCWRSCIGSRWFCSRFLATNEISRCTHQIRCKQPAPLQIAIFYTVAFEYDEAIYSLSIYCSGNFLATCIGGIHTMICFITLYRSYWAVVWWKFDFPLNFQ